MTADGQQQLTMLQIVYGACATAVDVLHVDDCIVDEQLVVDLEETVTRTRREIERLSALLAKAPQSLSRS